MYTLPTEFAAAVAAGRMASVNLVDLYCADSDNDDLTFRWSDRFEALSYPASDAVDGSDMVTYAGLDRRMEIQRDVRLSQTLASEPVRLILDGSRAGDDDDAIGAFMDCVWHQRRVRVRQVLLDFDTGLSPSEPVWQWWGRLDHRQLQTTPNEPSRLTVTCEGGLFRIRGRRMHTRTHADQQRRKAGDLFFQGTPLMIATPPLWGKAFVSLPGSGGGGSATAYRGPVRTDEN